mgnify:CR=1 FL=1
MKASPTARYWSGSPVIIEGGESLVNTGSTRGACSRSRAWGVHSRQAVADAGRSKMLHEATGVEGGVGLITFSSQFSWVRTL